MEHINPDWKPKPSQKRMLKAATTPGIKRTITAMCDEARIGRNTFYRWLEKDADFKHAWDTIWYIAIDQYMPSIVAGQIDKAIKERDTQAAKYLADLSGKMIKKVDHTSGGDKIKINVRVLDDND